MVTNISSAEADFWRCGEIALFYEHIIRRGGLKWYIIYLFLRTCHTPRRADLMEDSIFFYEHVIRRGGFLAWWGISFFYEHIIRRGGFLNEFPLTKNNT